MLLDLSKIKILARIENIKLTSHFFYQNTFLKENSVQKCSNKPAVQNMLKLKNSKLCNAPSTFVVRVA
jgi:hypothetical protein